MTTQMFCTNVSYVLRQPLLFRQLDSMSSVDPRLPGAAPAHSPEAGRAPSRCCATRRSFARAVGRPHLLLAARAVTGGALTGALVPQ